MDTNLIAAVIASGVSAVAYIVTTMIITRRNSVDIKELCVDVKALDKRVSGLDSRVTKLEFALEGLPQRITAIEADVAVIRALCQERSVSRRPDRTSRAL